MVGPSKILTVSYGTFSCTLEGFDEPFNTMKAIAEYFRDLAAEDRYFGAEPPTPDAEMLHRIAEREIQRRVEAKIGASGITLRPEGAQTAPQAPAPLEAASDLDLGQPGEVTVRGATDEELAAHNIPARALRETEVASPAAAPHETEADAAPADAAEGRAPAAARPAPAVTIEDLRAEPVPETVAAKLRRIREAVAVARAVEDTRGPLVFSEEIHAEEIEAPDAGPAPAATPDLGEADHDRPAHAPAPPLRGALEGDFGYSLEAEAPQDAPQADAERPGPDQPQDAPDLPEAAAPSRLRRAVRPHDAEWRAARRSARAEAAARVQAEMLARAETLAVAEAVAPELVAADEGEMLCADKNPAKIAEGGEQIASTGVDPFNDAENPHVSRTVEAIMQSSLLEDRGFPVPDEPDTETLAPEDGTGSADAGLLSAEEEAELAAVLAALSLGDEARDDRPAARPVEREPVLLLLPEHAAADLPPAQEPETEDTDADLIDSIAAMSEPFDEHGEEAESADAPQITPAQRPALSLQDWADDLAEDQDQETAPREAASLPLPPAAPSRALFEAEEPESGPDSPDLTRLMREADAKLEKAETRRRFSAIAHLKAAVAATVADRRMRSDGISPAPAGAPGEGLAAYTSDLTQAVRPRRPVALDGPATPRPGAAERPAPLVLVSEQRVDDPAPRAAEPVRPRRVTTADIARRAEAEPAAPRLVERIDPAEATSFQDFAARLNATRLEDLLEAAAAYAEGIEGRPHFTRPQIMSKVQALAGKSRYDREAGLRSFGTLLREGKIAKVKRGQFAITEQSRFYAEAHRAAR